jgi:L-threonylcarbamoyladenylate synthase
MDTELLNGADPIALQRALELLERGEIVAVPTDTVYGIAADGMNPNAVERIFAAKERPSHKAIILLLADYEDIERVAVYVSPTARRLAERFWPGGLTLVVRARPELPANLRAETDTIGVRLPDADIPRELARLLDNPLATTSANISGGANPQTAQDVLRDLQGRIALVLDGGPTRANVASTVLDCTVEPPRLLREGAVAVAEIEDVVGELRSG